jgi:hypothetical protein
VASLRSPHAIVLLNRRYGLTAEDTQQVELLSVGMHLADTEVWPLKRWEGANNEDSG